MNAEESRITADPAQARLPSRRRSMSACRRHPEPCREKVPRPLRPISAPPRPDIYRRGSRRLGGESSKHWKKKFQALEVLQGKVPSFESSISTAFRVCPALSVTCSRRRLYPALPAQSAQRGIPAAASQSRLVNGPIVNRRSLRSHRRVQPRSDTAGAAYSRIKEKNLP